MLKRGISGQFIFFDLVSVLSGYSVTGFSGQISGRKLMDSSPMAVLSGNIVEVSGGMYRANLYDWDTSGNNIGYFFTASGCVPRTFMVVTIDATSGFLWPASGVSTLTYSGQLSGQPIAGLSGQVYPASGVNATVPPASISGVTVTVPIATISGVTIASGAYPASGINVIVPPASISGVTVVVPLATISGNFVVASLLSGQSVLVYSGQVSGQPVTLISGLSTAYFASGSFDRNVFASGVLGASGGLPQAWGNSGAVTVGQNLDKSGYTATALSGAFVVANIASGSLFLASGSIFMTTFASGVVGGGSGNLPSSWGASGAIVAAIVLDKSGYTATALSGANVVVPISSISGVTIASGTFVTVPIATISGTNVVVPISSISGITVASGVYTASGINVTVPIASISGVTTTAALLSGQSVLVASGQLSGQVVSLYPWISPAVEVGVAQSGSSGTIVLDSGAIAADNWYVGSRVFLYGLGFGSGQVRTVKSYVAATRTATVDIPWSLSGVPLSGAAYSILAGDGPALSSGLTVTVGTNLDKSGYTDTPLSGAFVTVPASSISGVVIASGTYPASGVFATVPAASISGAVIASGTYPASGVFVTVPTASISGTNTVASLLSGQSVLVYSGQLSGQPVAPLSGFSYPASGVNTVASVSLASGTVYIASGTQVIPVSGLTYPASGVNTVVSPATLSGVTVTVPVATISGVTPASGATVVVPLASISGVNTVASLLSGQSVLVYSGQLSGQPIAGLSGFIYPASGVNVTATATTQSGQIFLASGSLVGLLSGQSVLVYSGQLSGQPVTPLSGFFYPASGVNTVAAVTLASGTVYIASGTPVVPVSGLTYPASGANAVVPPASLSGVSVTVPLATISGVTIASGATVVVPGASISGINVVGSLLSGQSVQIYSGQLSGQPITLLSGLSYTASGINTVASVTLASGTVYLASGTPVVTAINQDKSGYTVGTNLDKTGYTVTSGSTWLTSGQQVVPVSGLTYPASGINVVVLPATLSGVNTIVPLATLSGVNAVVPPATLSGVTVTVPLATLSGVTPASGATVVVPLSTISGANTVATLVSGQSVLVYSGQLSGQLITLLSGLSYTASGINTVANVTLTSGTVYIASGTQVVTAVNLDKSGYTSDTLSGQTYPASGAYTVATLLSGQIVQLYSGQATLPYSGQLSGQPIAGLSGYIYPASGVNVTATATIASGQVWLASGQAVGLTSGQNVLVYSGQLSGQPMTLLSGQSYVGGLASGQVYLASGQKVGLVSGQTVLVASGNLSGQYTTAQTVMDKSGYTLSASGLDTIPVESGLNFRQAQSINAAVLAGNLSGATTPSITIAAAGQAGTNRATASVDGSGNRLNVVLNAPI